MTILLRQKPLTQVVRQIVQRDNGAWFDPEDISTMFQDSAGTTPVTALEQPVGRWLDKSGNGNHATQSITASRPTLSARYNLLTKTEDFADAVWNKVNGAIVQSGFQGPDGRMSAAKLIAPVGTGYTRDVRQVITYNGPAQMVWYVKKAEFNFCMFVVVGRSSTSGESQTILDLTTLQQNFVVGSQTLVVDRDATTGWIRVSALKPAISGSTQLEMRFSLVNSLVDTAITGDGASGIYIATPSISAGQIPYQRVNTATDYDSVGFPKYIKAEGVDDFYNLPFMNLYGNGACSIVAARDAISQATDTYVISERSTTDVDPKYFPSRQLASGGNMDSYIVSDEGTVRLDTTGSAFSGAKLAAIRSVVDSGSNIKLFKDGAVVADDNYTRAGTLTLNKTTLGASVSTTTSNYANMRLYGLIVTKSALSDTDRRRCEQFLASRLTSLGVTLS